MTVRNACLAALGIVGLVLVLAVVLGTPPPPLPQVDGPEPEEEPPPAGEPPVDSSTRSGIEEQRSELYRALMALARDDPDAFRLRIDELLPPTEGSAWSRRAALRAWHDAGLADPVPALAAAVTDADFGEEGRELSLTLLQPRCRVDVRARDALIGFLRTDPAVADQRASAFRGVLRWADRAQIEACVPLLHAEVSPDVVVAAARALAASKTPGAQTTVEALHWRHPDAVVRRRLRALGIGR